MQGTETFKYVTLNETPKALLLGLEKERLPTPTLIVKGKPISHIVTYAKAWFPKRAIEVSDDGTVEVPTYLLETKAIHSDENQFMVFDTEGGW